MSSILSISIERKRILQFRKDIPLGYQCTCKDNISKDCNGLVPFSRFEFEDACRYANIEYNFTNYKRLETNEEVEKEFKCPFIGDISNKDRYCKLIDKSNKDAIHDRRPILCRISDFKANYKCNNCNKRIQKTLYMQSTNLNTISTDYAEYIINNDIIFDKIMNPKIFIDLYNESQREIRQRVEEAKKEKEIKDNFLFQHVDTSGIQVPDMRGNY